MTPRRRRSALILSLALLAATQLPGCAGVPVQEMSNARQAVLAAQKAGGAKYAPETMAEAEAHLKTAKSNLSKGEYRVARDEAELARAKATEARRLSEVARASEKPADKPGS